MMNRKSKGLFTISGFALTAVLAFGQTSENEGSMFCSCPQTVNFDHQLPMSHPINRCATEQSSEVSWSSWISGRSTSYQFHFIDLLELLSRHTHIPKERAPAQS
jgi:hypothetical protein